ncbi:tbc1 domain family member 22a [Anaeramoeba flamelloides]|uniref:Tbc1 domain family member 22a n=1 Tax=Anaeramoeba flamelloides TaxID=1746091 RepID=A0ABQ8YQ96_9EUKA|nr:tbc1 domain family member 22a [Anaeramoeba flamelloides]
MNEKKTKVGKITEKEKVKVKEMEKTKSKPNKKNNQTKKTKKKEKEKEKEKEQIKEKEKIKKTTTSREKRFLKVLDQEIIEIENLRSLSWSGIPKRLRSLTWKILLGYLPVNKSRRATTLERKRKEYREAISKLIHEKIQRNKFEKNTLHQLELDLPRTCSDSKLIQNPKINNIFKQVLYIWSVRHPASGYVQGMNDLVTPFFYTFFQDYIKEEQDPEKVDVDKIPEESLLNLEADIYWCFTKLLDGIQDNYTFANPGIQRMIFDMQNFIHHIDEPLHKHLIKNDVQFLQFAFRWMNCLLTREFSSDLLVRLWDTYFAESDGFAVFHVFVCDSILVYFSKEIQKLSEQNVLVFLQKLPIYEWTEEELKIVLAQAYTWKIQYEHAQSHLKN